MTYERVIVFDCETYPCLQAGRRMLGMAADVPDLEVRRALGRKYLRPGEMAADGTPRRPEDAFVKPTLHRVACISMLVAERAEAGAPYALTRVSTRHIGSCTENEIISLFLGTLGARPSPVLVGFNTGGFDLPVIRFRAFALGIPAPQLHKGGGNSRDYWYRYGKDAHVDLCDVLGSYGACPKPSLAELCALAEIPVKIGGMEGGQVEGMVAAGRLQEVGDYCETDVVATFLVYLRHLLVTGGLSPDAYARSVIGLRDGIADLAGGRPHLAPYVTMPVPSLIPAPTAETPHLPLVNA